MRERSFFTAVLLLGILAVLSVGGMVALSLFDKDIPQSLTATCSGCIGAIGGLLSIPPTRD